MADDRAILIELLRSVYLTEVQKTALARVLGVQLREPRVSGLAVTEPGTAVLDLQRFLHGSGAE